VGSRTNLTKTSFLVLFVILISASIGTASFANAQIGTVPDWVKNTAGWWSEGKVSTQEYLDGLEFLIKNEIIMVPGFIQIAQAQSVNQTSLNEIWATINSLQNQIDSIESAEQDQPSQTVEIESQMVGDLNIDGLLSVASPGSDTVSYNRIGPSSSVTGFVSDSSDLFVSDDIEALDNVYIGHDLYVGRASAGDSDFIYFDTALLESLSWNEKNQRFQLTDSLWLRGDLDITGGSATDDDTIFFHADSLPEWFMWDNSESECC